jgi:3-mercaptopyruvate sulfurtransferase SseA
MTELDWPGPAAAAHLISAAGLGDSLADGEPLVVLDARWRLAGPPGIDDYRAGHVPGAAYIDLDTVLSGGSRPPGPPLALRGEPSPRTPLSVR